MIKQSTDQLVCSECNGTNLLHDFESGELVCPGCGYVLSSTLLNLEPEWRAFDHAEKDSLPRVGAPITWTIHDKGISSSIGWQNKDHKGKSLSPEERAKHNRLRKWDRRSKVSDASERNLSTALNFINTICIKMNLPRNVVETSAMLYRVALKRSLIKGRTIRNLVAASIYMACRQCGVVRSLDEIASGSNISKKEVARDYRFLVKELKPRIPLTAPSSHISKIVNKLDLNGDTEALALQVLNQASELKLTGGRGPAGLAASCVYIGTLLLGERRTQSEIAREASVTEVTIRNRYKEFVQNLDITVAL